MFPPPPIGSSNSSNASDSISQHQQQQGPNNAISQQRPSSRRSSLSGSSNAPNSPHSSFRSPFPMPPPPAIRSLPATAAWVSVKLCGDERIRVLLLRRAITKIILMLVKRLRGWSGGGGGRGYDGTKGRKKTGPSVITETSSAISSAGGGPPPSTGNTTSMTASAADHPHLHSASTPEQISRYLLLVSYQDTRKPVWLFGFRRFCMNLDLMSNHLDPQVIVEEMLRAPSCSFIGEKCGGCAGCRHDCSGVDCDRRQSTSTSTRSRSKSKQCAYANHTVDSSASWPCLSLDEFTL